MGKMLSDILRDGGNGMLMFWCQGCDQAHGVWVEHPNNNGAKWNWNGDADAPTFSPSILVRGVRMTKKGEADLAAWREAGYPKREAEFEHAPHVCHSFVTGGRIQFLGDCTHAMAGQTVDIPEWPLGD